MSDLPPRLYHGTSALALSSIRREGLIEPIPGRGIGLVSADHIHMAQYHAWRAEWTQRHHCGSAETVGIGALIEIDSSQLDDVVFAPLGITINPFRGWWASNVPPAAIIGVETFAVALPEVGSLVDTALFAQGLGTPRTYRRTVPTMRHVRERLAAGDPCDRVRPDQYEAVSRHARRRVESWQDLREPHADALRLGRQHATKTADLPVPNAARLSRFRERLNEPGIASLVVDGEFYERAEIAAALGVELDALDAVTADKIANGSRRP